MSLGSRLPKLPDLTRGLRGVLAGWAQIPGEAWLDGTFGGPLITGEAQLVVL